MACGNPLAIIQTDATANGLANPVSNTIMPRKKYGAKVKIIDLHKREVRRIPTATIRYHNGRLAQTTSSVTPPRKSRTASKPTRDVDAAGLEAAGAEDAHDFELPASVDTEDDPPTEVNAKVGCVPLTSNLY
jgi:hypothetical protein